MKMRIDLSMLCSRKTHLFHTFAFATLIASFFAMAAPVRAQSDCQAVYDAQAKLNQTSHRTVTSTPVGASGQVISVQTILAGGVLYINHNGQWKKSGVTLDQLKQTEELNRKTATNVSCHLSRTESVAGEPAAVYSMHSENEGIKFDTTLWVSKSSGLPLRREQDVDTGGSDGKSHTSERYSFSNVAAPSIPSANIPAAK
jgi:hypothetical protein